MNLNVLMLWCWDSFSLFCMNQAGIHIYLCFTFSLFPSCMLGVHWKSKVYTHHNSLHLFVYVYSIVMRLIWAYGRFFVLIIHKLRNAVRTCTHKPRSNTAQCLFSVHAWCMRSTAVEMKSHELPFFLFLSRFVCAPASLLIFFKLCDLFVLFRFMHYVLIRKRRHLQAQKKCALIFWYNGPLENLLYKNKLYVRICPMHARMHSTEFESIKIEICNSSKYRIQPDFIICSILFRDFLNE